MSSWVETFKPAATRRTHLLLVALLWTAVGTLLFFFGARWVLRGHTVYPWIQLTGAAAVGAAKARFVLDRTAGRIVARIRVRGDDRCIGGFLSPKTWLLVVCMMTAGRLLRASPLPIQWVGLLYAAIGTALALAARTVWWAWYQQGRPA